MGDDRKHPVTSERKWKKQVLLMEQNKPLNRVQCVSQKIPKPCSSARDCVFACVPLSSLSVHPLTPAPSWDSPQTKLLEGLFSLYHSSGISLSLTTYRRTKGRQDKGMRSPRSPGVALGLGLGGAWERTELISWRTQ
ncbi:uncharacterized protein LOC116154070 isoform X1 [Camelus dromedarius]|uniref:uncharacterized protein LOC116154070 isoform X1 n=1 Tax=Camelus dromedarius TaxID=9838 RepID=UPI0012636440|nr:uncharacterized protein LOC116154070 isoform X2 [Camelus dromedarius]